MARQEYADALRPTDHYNQEKELVFNFVTDNFDRSSATTALLYRYSRQIEIFFKWIKQHLRIFSLY